MKENMERLIKFRQSLSLSIEERNLFNLAYKNHIGSLRMAWRALGPIKQRNSKNSDQMILLKEYQKKIQNEIMICCNEVFDLLIPSMLSKLSNDESKVFFLKMNGDYNRFLAECSTGDLHNTSKNNAEKAYNESILLAKSVLKPTNPTRLGLALNYSVFYYEVTKETTKACDLAKSAFDEAIAFLDQLEENEYKDSTTIMQLIRDNLILWTSEENDDQDKVLEVKDSGNQGEKDSNKLQDYSLLSREELVFMSKVSEEVERFEDMMGFINQIVLLGKDLSFQERNFLHVASKNIIGSRRSAGHILRKLEETEPNQNNLNLLTVYRQQIDKELIDICNEVLSLIDQNILKNVGSPEGKIFFLKMKGDSYRWISEVSNGAALKISSENCGKAYNEGNDLAKSKLKPTDPIRLGLVLNYSVYLYEIANDKMKACTFAKQAFDNAIGDLDNLGDDQYKDATAIMQLIRDNLTLWTN